MTHESSRSQGKGSRRMPGRRGGAGKRKRQEWEKQTHRVESPDRLPHPVTRLSFATIWGKSRSEWIYLFDQKMAKAGIPYFAELEGGRRQSVFTITVAQDTAANVQEIIDQLRPPTVSTRPVRFGGMWTDLEATRLAKAYQDHPWVFAVYWESASDRDDGREYVAFLFRNKERTVFGIKEWLGENVLVRHDVLARMAHRIVTDIAYRRQFISQDPDLIKMWKRH